MNPVLSSVILVALVVLFFTVIRRAKNVEPLKIPKLRILSSPDQLLKQMEAAAAEFAVVAETVLSVELNRTVDSLEVLQDALTPERIKTFPVLTDRTLSGELPLFLALGAYLGETVRRTNPEFLWVAPKDDTELVTAHGPYLVIKEAYQAYPCARAFRIVYEHQHGTLVDFFDLVIQKSQQK